MAELDHALEAWPIWVDTAHQPPYDLMTGELSMTYGIAYDWLYEALTPAERTRIREGVERRAGRPEGVEDLGRPGARNTGYFPIVFNPGRTLSASFGDSPSRAQDPIFSFSRSRVLETPISRGSRTGPRRKDWTMKAGRRKHSNWCGRRRTAHTHGDRSRGRPRSRR